MKRFWTVKLFDNLHLRAFLVWTELNLLLHLAVNMYRSISAPYEEEVKYA